MSEDDLKFTHTVKHIEGDDIKEKNGDDKKKDDDEKSGDKKAKDKNKQPVYEFDPEKKKEVYICDFLLLLFFYLCFYMKYDLFYIDFMCLDHHWSHSRRKQGHTHD